MQTESTNSLIQWNRIERPADDRVQEPRGLGVRRRQPLSEDEGLARAAGPELREDVGADRRRHHPEADLAERELRGLQRYRRVADLSWKVREKAGDRTNRTFEHQNSATNSVST